MPIEKKKIIKKMATIVIKYYCYGINFYIILFWHSVVPMTRWNKYW